MNSDSGAKTKGRSYDPICGVPVEGSDRSPSSEYKKRRYFFCSDKCKHEFGRAVHARQGEVGAGVGGGVGGRSGGQSRTFQFTGDTKPPSACITSGDTKPPSACIMSPTL